MSEPMRVLFDTKEYWSTLKAAGIPEGHATAIVDGLDRAMHQGVATHEDVVALNSDISSVKSDIAIMKGDIAGLKTDVLTIKGDIAGLKTDMATMESRLILKLGSLMLGLVTISTAVLALVIVHH